TASISITSSPEQPLFQYFGLPGPYVGFPIELGADVVLLHAVAIDHAQLLDTLTRKVVRQLGAERPRSTESQTGFSQLGQTICSTIDRFVMEFVSHGLPLRSPRRAERAPPGARRCLRRHGCQTDSPEALADRRLRRAAAYRRRCTRHASSAHRAHLA